jgi:DNA invertase Pin-like site-specific DNA recombinase
MSSSGDLPRYKKGYLRVSTKDQNPQLQYDALVAAGVSPEDILTDIESGSVNDRKNYQVLISEIRKGAIDEVWVYRIDRLGRDQYELVNYLQILEKHDCALISICEPFVKDWKSSSWAFRALWEAIGDARFELLRLKERQRAGIKAARDRGVHLGRPRKKAKI